MQTLKDGFIPPHGGYRKLLSFQKAEIIFDGTEYFCAGFFKPGNRTIDQMTQAARSGKQNIGEGSMASATSSQLSHLQGIWFLRILFLLILHSH